MHASSKKSCCIILRRRLRRVRAGCAGRGAFFFNTRKAHAPGSPTFRMPRIARHRARGHSVIMLSRGQNGACLTISASIDTDNANYLPQRGIVFSIMTDIRKTICAVTLVVIGILNHHTTTPDRMHWGAANGL